MGKEDWGCGEHRGILKIASRIYVCIIYVRYIDRYIHRYRHIYIYTSVYVYMGGNYIGA